MAKTISRTGLRLIEKILIKIGLKGEEQAHDVHWQPGRRLYSLKEREMVKLVATKVMLPVKTKKPGIDCQASLFTLKLMILLLDQLYCLVPYVFGVNLHYINARSHISRT
jgi:hypothetical protein